MVKCSDIVTSHCTFRKKLVLFYEKWEQIHTSPQPTTEKSNNFAKHSPPVRISSSFSPRRLIFPVKTLLPASAPTKSTEKAVYAWKNESECISDFPATCLPARYTIFLFVVRGDDKRHGLNHFRRSSSTRDRASDRCFWIKGQRRSCFQTLRFRNPGNAISDFPSSRDFLFPCLCLSLFASETRHDNGIKVD